MDLPTLIFDLTFMTLSLIGPILVGAVVWTKLGGHKSLLVTIPLAIACTLTIKDELPLVVKFTPEVIGGLVISHLFTVAIMAAFLYSTIKAGRLKQREKESNPG